MDLRGQTERFEIQVGETETYRYRRYIYDCIWSRASIYINIYKLFIYIFFYLLMKLGGTAGD